MFYYCTMCPYLFILYMILHLNAVASIPPEAMVCSPKMAGCVPQFLIIMHLKCCADR